MSSKNIRQPITIAPKIFAYDKSFQIRLALFLSGIAITIFILFCCPVLMVIQITNFGREQPAATFYEPSNVDATKAFPPSRTPRPSQPSSTPPVVFTSTSKENPVAKISCANKLYNVNLRRTPGYIDKNDASDSIYEVPCGEFVELLGDTENVDGLTWWYIQWNGFKGWMADHTASGKTILIFNP